MVILPLLGCLLPVTNECVGSYAWRSFFSTGKLPTSAPPIGFFYTSLVNTFQIGFSCVQAKSSSVLVCFIVCVPGNLAVESWYQGSSEAMALHEIVYIYKDPTTDALQKTHPMVYHRQNYHSHSYRHQCYISKRELSSTRSILTV